jgi:hypothetical protein
VLLRLSQAYPRATPVLIDEFDTARCFQRAALETSWAREALAAKNRLTSVGVAARFGAGQDRSRRCADPDHDPLSRTLPTVLTVFASVVYIPDDPASGAAFPTEGNLDLPGQRLRAIS